MWLLLFILLVTLTGILLQYLLHGGLRALGAEKLALSPLLGAAVLGSSLVFCFIVFDRFIPALTWLIPAALLAALLVRSFLSADERPPVSDTMGVKDLPFLGVALLLAALLLAVSYKDGVYGDALSFWGLKALILAENDSLRIPEFLDNDYFHHHKDYPLLFPSLQACLYRISGQVLDRTAKLLYPLLLLSTSLYLYFHLRRRHGRWAAFTGGALCLMTPSICGFHPGICSGYMDIPLGCFSAVALLTAAEWLREGHGADAVKTGLLLGAMALTKNEGIAAAAAAVVLLVCATVFKEKKWRIQILLLLLPVAVLAGTWLAFRAQLPPGHGDYLTRFMGGEGGGKLAQVPQVAWRYLLELLHFERWGFLWIGAGLAAAAWCRKDGLLIGLFIGVVMVIQILGVAFSSLELRYQMASAIFRLVGQIAPLAAACVGMAMNQKRGKTWQAGAERSSDF
jgi:hypothetical protein